MKCPKCGNEMQFGEIGIDRMSIGTSLLFWTPKEFYSGK